MLSHVKGQTDPVVRRKLCTGGGINRYYIPRKTSRKKNPEIASISMALRWGNQWHRAFGKWFAKLHLEGSPKHIPVWQGPGICVIESPHGSVSSIAELLLNSGWVSYPLCCFPRSHRMEMIIFDWGGGGWQNEPLQFLKCSKIHKWMVQYGPWKYHLHLAWPPLELLFTNNRRQPKSN